MSKIGSKFRNFVFRKRLGKTHQEAKIIISAMWFLDKFQIYSNSGDVNNNDHYVPRLLLNRWRISEDGTKKGKTFFWSKDTGLIDEKSIKSEVFCEENWDIANAQGAPSDYVSKKIYAELLEDKTNHIIKHLNKKENIKLTYIEESTLSVFVAHQITRVPKFHDNIMRFISIGYSEKLISQEDLANKEALQCKIVDNSIGVSYEDFLSGKPEFIALDGKQQRLIIHLQVADKISEKIYRTNHLKILDIPNDDINEFVISDNPVVVFDLERKKVLEFVPWWEIGVQRFLYFMPISPKKALMYTPVNDDENIPVKEFIDLINFAQYENCTKGVISRSDKILEEHTKFYNLKSYTDM